MDVLAEKCLAPLEDLEWLKKEVAMIGGRLDALIDVNEEEEEEDESGCEARRAEAGVTNCTPFREVASDAKAVSLGNPYHVLMVLQCPRCSSHGGGQI